MRRNRSAGGLLLIVVPLLALFPLHNNDLWWHLATGRWIVQHGAVPREDIFSWTHFLGAWIDNEWLAQVVFYGTFRMGGYGALVALRAALFFLCAWLLRRYLCALRIPSQFPAAVAVAVALSHHWWELRPSLFSLLALFVLLISLERRRLTLLPLLFLLWANVHPGFLFGLIVLAAVTVAAALETLTVNWRRSYLPVARLLAVLGASALATLINPYGWRVYVQQMAIASNRDYRMLLDEWIVPPLPFLAVVVGAIGVVLWNVRRIPLHRLAIFFAIATISMTAVRFEELFAWVAAALLLTLRRLRRVNIIMVVLAVLVGWFPPAARPADVQSDFYRGTATRQRIATVVTAVVAIAFSQRRVAPLPALATTAALGAVALLSGAPTRSSAQTRFALIEPSRYPTRCLDAIPQNARLFNRLSWGGWLMWQRSLPTFIDGRSAGEPLFFEFVAAQVRYARHVLDRRGVDWVIASPAEGVVRQLATMPEWELVCRDEASVVLRRKVLAAREFSP